MFHRIRYFFVQIMLKFRKDYNLKIISLLAVGLLFLNNSSYGKDLPLKNYLRSPLISDSIEGEKRLEKGGKMVAGIDPDTVGNLDKKTVRGILYRIVRGELDVFSKKCISELRDASASMTDISANMVVSEEGDGILIIGPSRSGKTTLTHIFQELEEDYFFVGDDAMRLVYPYNHKDMIPVFSGPLYGFPLFPGQNEYGVRKDSAYKNISLSPIRKATPDLYEIKLVIFLGVPKGMVFSKKPDFGVIKEITDRQKFLKTPFSRYDFGNLIDIEALRIPTFLTVSLPRNPTPDISKEIVKAALQVLGEGRIILESRVKSGGSHKNSLLKKIGRKARSLLSFL